MLFLRSPTERAWERFLEGEPAEVSEALARSWSRSMSAGVDWRAPQVSSRAPAMFDTPDVRQRQERNARAWRHVEPVLEGLSMQLARGGFVGVWADPDGVILHRRGGGEFLSTAQRVELLEGANWGEGARGTNAIGTALREAREVAVLGRAHLQQTNHGLVCYATPICGPQGEPIGVLDVTSHVECAQPMASAALVAARSAVELALKRSAYGDAVPGGLDGVCALMELCPSPAFLVERDGMVRAVNARATARFGARLPPVRGGWSWATLMRLRGEREVVTLVAHDGVSARWRAAVEAVGPAERPVAALVFLEPVANALRASQTTQARSRIAAREAAPPDAPLDALGGNDLGIARVKRLARALAPTALPLLLLAETGTGKERLARALHAMSARASGPFMPINCAALSRGLLESELFGYAAGAFTGAKPGGAQGKIAAAAKGTLFLDEVADLPPNAQAMLLRVLEDGSYYRVGDSTERRADVRIIAATSRDIEQLVRDGAVRADLFFRLKGATLTLPPLRARADLILIAERLLAELAASARAPTPPLMSPAFTRALRAHPWPGNIRELKNALHVAWALSDHAPMLEPDDLPDDITRPARLGVGVQVSARPAPVAAAPVAALSNPPCSAPRDAPSDDGGMDLRRRAEVRAVRDALDRADGNMSRAARLLGVARSTLYRMMERHGLR